MLQEDKLTELIRVYSRHQSSVDRIGLYQEVARLGFIVSAQRADIHNQLGAEVPTFESQVAAYAKVQVNGLPDLHQHLCVRLWSIAEAYISDVCRCLLVHGQPTIGDDIKANIPLKLLVAERDDEWYDEVLNALERTRSGKLKSGADALEARLEVFGLDGKIDATVKQFLYLCSKCRNCIVHCDGKIDERLSKAVPELSQGKGHTLGLTAKLIRQFTYSIGWYMLEVQSRIIPNGHAKHQDIEADKEDLIRCISEDPVHPAPPVTMYFAVGKTNAQTEETPPRDTDG